MRRCEESDIEFDFSAARSLFTHDSQCHCEGDYSEDGNSVFPGVDFRLEDADGWIWLEVKNWRGRMRGSFKYKIKSEAYAEEMRGKYLGTATFLAYHNKFTPDPVRYVLLFEPPNTFDEALLAPFQDLVRRKMPNVRRFDITIFVMNLDRWNMLFPDYPAKKLR